MGPSHELWMHRCLTLALHGIPSARPNPYTGAVIVHRNRIVGEGFHRAPGTPHAEQIALQNARKSGIPLEECTLYVNLEPCIHYGRTPPCAPAIVEAGIRTVVFAHPDPDPRVSGKGQTFLREHSVSVVHGILEEEARWLNRRYLFHRQYRRPYVVLKWTQDLLGTAGTLHPDKRLMLSSRAGALWTQRWRLTEDAILIGIQTFIRDLPSLTYRPCFHETPDESPYHPAVVLIDRRGRLRTVAEYFSRFLKTAPERKVILFTVHTLPRSHRHWLESLSREHPNLHWYPVEHLSLHQILKTLDREFSFLSILVEGGPTLHREFVRLDLWEEIRVHGRGVGGGGWGGIDAIGGEAFKEIHIPGTGCWITGTSAERSELLWIGVHPERVGKIPGPHWLLV